MAELEFVLFDINETPYYTENVISYELTRDISAPCDGLRLNFISKNPLEEINRVKAYSGDRLIFNGYCDTQREESVPLGNRVFIFARSSACLLVDNEAVTRTYQSPSAKSLFIINAKGLGFKFSFDDCFCEGAYTVGKGASCYSAINSLVSAVKKRNIIITPENDLTVPEGKNILKLDGEKIISEKKIINRASPISRIDYKTSDSAGYVYHFKSRTFEKAGIKRSKKLNLSALPDWQRSFVLKNVMNDAAVDYNVIEIVTTELVYPELYDSVLNYEDYSVKSVYRIFDGGGEKCVLRLFKEIETEEIMYVD